MMFVHPRPLFGSHATAAMLLILALLATACGNVRRPKVGDGPKGPVQRGLASWYGEPFHGRQTASGEVYDMHGLSAAHKALPLGTWVRVRHLGNGRTVTVRINDRGPFIRGRIIDLSLGAAQALSMKHEGVAKVEVRVVDTPEGTLATLVPPPKRFVIQIGAFTDRDHALELKLKLADDHPDVRIVRHRDIHRVRLGDYGHKRDAQPLLKRLRARGYDALIIAESRKTSAD